MKARTSFLPKWMALLLSLALGFPAPAAALRPVAPAENETAWLVQQELVSGVSSVSGLEEQPLFQGGPDQLRSRLEQEIPVWRDGRVRFISVRAVDTGADVADYQIRSNTNVPRLAGRIADDLIAA